MLYPYDPTTGLDIYKLGQIFKPVKVDRLDIFSNLLKIFLFFAFDAENI